MFRRCGSTISGDSYVLAFATTVVWLMGMLAAALLLVQRFPEPVFAWGLRLGIVVALAGMAAGYFMTSPTPPQLAAARAGQGLPIAGAHSVGAPDGGPGQ